jgi:hypothetical protein
MLQNVVFLASDNSNNKVITGVMLLPIASIGSPLWSLVYLFYDYWFQLVFLETLSVRVL